MEDNEEAEKRDEVQQEYDAEQREDVEQKIEDAGNKDFEDGEAVVKTDVTSQDIMILEYDIQYTEQVHKEMENEIGRLKEEVDKLVFKEEPFLRTTMRRFCFLCAF